MSSFTDLRVLQPGANQNECTKLMHTLRTVKVSLSTIVFDWLLPTCEWYITILS